MTKTPLDWVREAAGQLPEPVGQAVATAADIAEGIIFADGSLPAGTNPTDIYAWFHNGPGTAGYERAADTLRTLAEAFPDYTAEIKAAQQDIVSGWTGPAADSSARSFDPLLKASAQLERHAVNARSSVADQVTSFNVTKNRVVPVPAQPPSGPGMNQFTQPLSPENLTADAAVAGYQLATYANQDAYGSYQGQTTPQGKALPQDQAGSTVRPVEDAPVPPAEQQPAPGPPPVPQPPVTPPPPSAPPGETGSRPPGGQPAPTQPPGTSQAGFEPGENQPGQQKLATTDSVAAPHRTIPAAVTPSLPDPSARPATGTSPLPGGQSGYAPPVTGFGGSGRSTSGVSGGSPAGRGGGASAGRAPGGFAGAGPNSPTHQTTGRPAAAVGANGRQAGGTGTVPGGAGTGQGDEDIEHVTKYVLKTERENELIGDLPAHAPAVIEGFGDDDA